MHHINQGLKSGALLCYLSPVQSYQSLKKRCWWLQEKVGQCWTMLFLLQGLMKVGRGENLLLCRDSSSVLTCLVFLISIDRQDLVAAVRRSSLDLLPKAACSSPQLVWQPHGGRWRGALEDPKLKKWGLKYGHFSFKLPLWILIWYLPLLSPMSPLSVMLCELKCTYSASSKKYSIYTLKWPHFFSAIFPAEQILQLLVLRVKVNRKNTNKKYGRPCQVQPILLSFWDFGSLTISIWTSDLWPADFLSENSLSCEGAGRGQDAVLRFQNKSMRVKDFKIKYFSPPRYNFGWDKCAWLQYWSGHTSPRFLHPWLHQFFKGLIPCWTGTSDLSRDWRVLICYIFEWSLERREQVWGQAAAIQRSTDLNDIEINSLM